MTLGKFRSLDQLLRFQNKHQHLFNDIILEIRGFYFVRRQDDENCPFYINNYILLDQFEHSKVLISQIEESHYKSMHS
jgi:hypothetical protein